jgi:hypothetical protein
MGIVGSVQNQSFTKQVYAGITHFSSYMLPGFLPGYEFYYSMANFKSMFSVSPAAVAVLPGIEILKVSIVIPLMLAMHWILRGL